MEKGSYVYIKGPRGSYAQSYAGEIGEIVEILPDMYPDLPPDQRDLYRVALEPEALDRCRGVQMLMDADFWRLKHCNHLALKGDERFGLLFHKNELEAYPESPVVG